MVWCSFYYKRKIGPICTSHSSRQTLHTQFFIDHLIHSNSEKEKLLEFSERADRHETELDSLINHQTLNVVYGIRIRGAATGANVDILVKYFIMEAADDKETEAREFLDANGGEEAVQNVTTLDHPVTGTFANSLGLQDPKLLAEFATKFNQTLTEKLQKSLKESLHDSLEENR